MVKKSQIDAKLFIGVSILVIGLIGLMLSFLGFAFSIRGWIIAGSIIFSSLSIIITVIMESILK